MRFILALAVPVLVLGLSGCNELQATFDPPTQLKATANPVSTLQVDAEGEYTAGEVYLRLENPKTDSLGVLVSLASPPPGVALAPSSTRVTVSRSGTTTLPVKLQLNPALLFGAGNTVQLNLTLRLTPDEPSVAPVSLNFALSVQRAGGSTGGGGTPPPSSSPSIDLSLVLDRVAVFPGDRFTGQAVVTSKGGASGLTVVEIVPASGCSLPANAVRYTSQSYGDLTAGGTFTVSFEVNVPGNAQPGGCALEARAKTGSLQASAGARFDILALPRIALQVGQAAPVIQGEQTAKVPFTLTPEGGWTGLVEMNLMDTTNGASTPLTSNTVPTYAVVVGTTFYAPDAQGRLFLPVNGQVEGYLVLVNSSQGGWQAGQYTYLVRAIGPNVVQVPFGITVVNPNPQ